MIFANSEHNINNEFYDFEDPFDLEVNRRIVDSGVLDIYNDDFSSVDYIIDDDDEILAEIFTIQDYFDWSAEDEINLSAAEIKRLQRLIDAAIFTIDGEFRNANKRLIKEIESNRLRLPVVQNVIYEIINKTLSREDSLPFNGSIDSWGQSAMGLGINFSVKSPEVFLTKAQKRRLGLSGLKQNHIKLW